MGIKIQDITSKSAKIASTDLIEIAQVSGATYVSRKVTGSEINELSLDTTPQLGGNLDVNGNSIVSTSNGNITIEPNGTGDILLNADAVRIGDSNTDATIATNGTGDLILTTNQGAANQGVIRIYDGANGNIELLPNGTGSILVGGNSTQATELRFMEDSDNGTNYVALKANDTLAANTTYTLPTADGTNTQMLTTNGSGTLSWSSSHQAVPVQSVASAATVTPTATNQLVTITAQAAGLTLAAPTGSPVEGQPLMIRIKDNGTARGITWTSGAGGYRAIGVTLPTTTVLSKTTYVGLIYNSTDNRWDAIGVTTEA